MELKLNLRVPGRNKYFINKQIKLRISYSSPTYPRQGWVMGGNMHDRCCAKGNERLREHHIAYQALWQLLVVR